MLSVALSSIQSTCIQLLNKDLYTHNHFLSAAKASLLHYEKSRVILDPTRKCGIAIKGLRVRLGRCISAAAQELNSRYNTGAGFNDYPEGVFDSQNFSSVTRGCLV